MTNGEVEQAGGHSERAYAALVKAIARCELPPGAVFNERDEAAKLGMSRTPFRQALHRLALEGLVSSVPKRGVHVNLLSLTDIRSHMVVRMAVEMEMVRRVMVEGKEMPTAELRSLTARMQAASRAHDVRGFLELDEAFHMTLVQAAGNEPAIDTVKRSWIHVNRARYLETAKRPDIRTALAEHRRLLAALEAGDVDGAVGAVREHLERSLLRLGEVTKRIPSAFLDPVDDGEPDRAAGETCDNDASIGIPTPEPVG